MTGQMMNYSKYYEHLKVMPQPITPSQLPKVKIDMDGIVKYAKEKGKEVTQLSEEEKSRFISE